MFVLEKDLKVEVNEDFLIGMRLTGTECFSSADTPRARSSRRRRDELAAIEGDTDTDDEIFSRTQTRRTRGERRKEKSPIKKEFVMNGDDIEEHNSHMEVGEGR